MADDNLIHAGDCEGKRVPQEKENQAPNEPNSKPQRAETPSAVVPSKSNEPPTPRHQGRKRYKCIKEEIKYWFEVFAIIGGLVGLVLIWLQYRDMTRATDASVKQSKALIAQSGIMQGQLKEMQDARELDERAWIVLTEPVVIQPYSAEQVALYIKIINTGKTPATIEHTDYSVIRIHHNSGITNVGSDVTIAPFAVIIPPDSPESLDLAALHIGKDDFNSLTNHQMAIVFHVRIQYRDIFKNVRHTEYSVLITGTFDELKASGILPNFGGGFMD